ncbi:hypothetical protein [Streptomyces sp. NBC_00029]|uniref:hypothetical protein n=1 Tax=Streptomyces sp. NBC_00029 TaxID=2903613 RepID=UPI00386F5E20
MFFEIGFGAVLSMTLASRRRPERHPRAGRTAPVRTSGADTVPSRTDSPWRNPDFRTLFGAATLSRLGTNTGHVAVPLLALTALDASPTQFGTPAALSTLAFLLIGLPAGAGVDRLRTGRALITADLARAALFASLPLARWLDALTPGQPYAAVLLGGVAARSYRAATPRLLRRRVPEHPAAAHRPGGPVRANTATAALKASPPSGARQGCGVRGGAAR